MLSLQTVQILAGTSLLAIAGGFVVNHALGVPPRERVRIVAKGHPARWTEVAWLGGTAVATAWSIGVLLAPAYAYHWPALPDFAYSWVVQLLGFAGSFVGGGLFFAASRTLGRHMTPAIQVREGHQLVQDGPYGYIRHPVYTAIVTAAGSFTVLYLSPILAVLTVFLAGLAMYRARLEEQLLSSPEAFGEKYRDYIGRTGRFLPRIGSKP